MVLEASCGAMQIARLLREGPVGRVVVCNAAERRAISHARGKSDRFDAAMLAKLLAAGMLAEVWLPHEQTSALRRRVGRRAGLVRARTRVKNETHVVLGRCLLGRPPVSDLFGKSPNQVVAYQRYLLTATGRIRPQKTPAERGLCHAPEWTLLKPFSSVYGRSRCFFGGSSGSGRRHPKRA